MSRTVLLLGNDISWLDALEIELAAEKWATVPVHRLKDALNALGANSEPFAAASAVV